MGRGKRIPEEVIKAVHKMFNAKVKAKDIGKFFSHTKTWVYRVIKFYSPETGRSLVEKKRGTKRKTTTEQDQELVEFFKKNATSSQNEALKKLAAEGTIKGISQSTLSRRLREKGARKPRPDPGKSRKTPKKAKKTVNEPVIPAPALASAPAVSAPLAVNMNINMEAAMQMQPPMHPNYQPIFQQL